MSEETKTEKTADEMMAELEGLSDAAVAAEEQTAAPEAPKPPETPDAPEASPEAPETPAETPAAEDAPEAPEVADESEVKPETPDVTPAQPEADEKPKHPAQLRIANRELREKLEAAEAANVALQEQQSSQAPVPTQTTQQKADPMAVFAALVTAENEGYDGEANNALAKHSALQILENDLSTQELDGVLAAAGQGVFGESGRDVAAQVQSIRSRVATREMTVQSEEQATQAAFQKDLQAVAKDFPELLNADSDAAKAVAEWDDVFIGKTDSRGRIIQRGALSDAQAAYIQSNPYMHATLAMSIKDAPQVQSVTSELEATKKELAGLKEKLALLESPEGASAPTGQSTGKNEKTADELIAKLAAMGHAA